MPEMLGPVIAARRRSGSATSVADHEKLGWQRAFEDARIQGYEAGQAEALAAQRRADQLTAHLNSLLTSMSKPLAAIDAESERQFCLLALQIGKQLARRELKVDPTQIVAIVRETLAQLPPQARSIRVLVHPSDAAVLRQCLVSAEQSAAWSLVEDPVLTSGGCRIESEHSSIDASFEARVASIVASLMEPVTPAADTI
jgi:flagellar assembly protein FliH